MSCKKSMVLNLVHEGKFFLNKLVVIQLSQGFPYLIQSLTGHYHAQGPITEFSPKSDDYRPYPHTSLAYIHFSLITI
jgi:hypothetical protein